MVNPAAQDATVQHAVDALAQEFAGTFGRETVERCLLDSMDQLARGATVPYFIPLLGQRFARERLTATAQAQGTLEKTMPEVLYVCVHNAGRSQMAAGLTHALSGGQVQVRSAGSAPAGHINPAVVEVMSELGIDLSREFPKPLTDEVVEAADVVITMGCGDACPVYPGKRYLDWELEDPAGKPVETVRRIRDDIRTRVEGLLRELDVPVVAR